MYQADSSKRYDVEAYKGNGEMIFKLEKVELVSVHPDLVVCKNERGREVIITGNIGVVAREKSK